MIRLRTNLPRTVTHAQTGLICDILGLPAGDVIAVSVDPKYGVTAELHLRTETGRIATGYDGDPLVSTVELAYDDGAELPTTPPSSYCEPTITTEVRDLEPDADGWRQGENTGRACVTCPCGLITGWVDTARAQQVFQAHTRPSVQ